MVDLGTGEEGHGVEDACADEQYRYGDSLYSDNKLVGARIGQIGDEAYPVEPWSTFVFAIHVFPA